MSADLISRGILPRPEFKPCDMCEMRSTCRASRHCAGARPCVTPPRFFMEHGMIHDSVSGQHVHTDDSVEPGATQRLYSLLTELSSGGAL